MLYPHVCLFIGHRDTSADLYPEILEAVKKLISEGVTEFWSGGYGNFDHLGEKAVLQCKQQGANVKLVLVLAYLPDDRNDVSRQEYYCRFDEIIRPSLGDGHTPPKYAISKRNAVIAKQAGHVISGVQYTWGGAAKTLAIAQRNGAVIHEVIRK